MKKKKNPIRPKDVKQLSQVDKRTESSPFDVKGISTKVTTTEMLETLRTEREKREYEN